MLIKLKILEAIRAGAVSLAYRRWKRASVRPGTMLRTAVGELEIESVDKVSQKSVTDGDAQSAGYASKAELLAELKTRTGDTYRIALRYAGPDRRHTLRAKATFTPEERAELEGRLARMDARSGDGPWTRATLDVIAARPAVRAGDLAADLGQERLYFKRRVRRLKELGLTISLGVGYELSPRGKAFLKGAG